MPWLETFMVACIDAALAAQNAVVAAQSLGLRTVYIGAMRNDPVRVAELLGLPPRAFVVFGLCVGYADPKARNEVKPRLPQSIVLHHERYDAAPEAKDRPAYDAEMSKFSARNEMQATTWTPADAEPHGPDQVDERARKDAGGPGQAGIRNPLGAGAPPQAAAAACGQTMSPLKAISPGTPPRGGRSSAGAGSSRTGGRARSRLLKWRHA